MSRLRTTIPILLLSSLATPAVGEFNTSHCAAAPGSPRCEAERAREFAAARNAEIEASMAAVAANRARLAAAKTHCKSSAATSPRCLAERAREFAKARNAEIEASIAAVKAERGLLLAARLTHCATARSTTPRCLAERKRELVLAVTHCKTPDTTTPRCVAQRTREFAAARNAEIEASIARVEAQRARAFAAARNAEIEQSIAAVNAERARAMALATTYCKTSDSTTPRCLAERSRRFAAARNAEIEASIAAVKAERVRKFAMARNAEIERSMAAVNAERARVLAARNASITTASACQSYNWLTAACNAGASGTFLLGRSPDQVKADADADFAAARNAEIDASIARVKAERERAFAAARNAEINASIAVVEFRRQRNLEIERSIAARKAQQALRLALIRRKSRGSAMPEMEQQLASLDDQRVDEQWETGAIGELSIDSVDPRPQPSSRRSPQQMANYVVPCRVAGHNLDPLHFTSGGTKLDAGMKATLNQLAMIAKSCPSVRLEIHGYTDASGPSQVKRLLSHRRAQAARSYLVSQGVDRSRLSAIGHGDAEPLVPNTTAANRARNRRIEIKMMDPAMHAVARRIMWDLAELLDPTYVPPLAQLSP